MISEQLRVTLLSLKQISDRLKLLNTTSVTKSEALAYKNEIIAALEDIDFTEITEALDSIDEKIGTAPAGSDKATLFAWLTTIYEYLAGQTPEDIPEGLGDRINLLLQFFNLPQSLPEYHAMTEAEVLEIADEEWDAMYGFVAVPNTVHTVDGGGSEREFTTYMNPTKTYADYGWPALWDAQDETIALTDHPTAGRVIYTFNPNND